MKCSFAEDPTLSQRLFDFLDIVFPGLQNAAQRTKALGTSWESVSTPYVTVEEGRIVSHVGVIGLSLILMGQNVAVGSVHAVATRPEYRRRGHYRRLMEELLQDNENRFETLILTTENPEYYEPFGFRTLGEHCFTLRVQSQGDVSGLRLIDKQDTRDIDTLQRLLKTREPVSQVVGVVNEQAVFCFNEGGRPLNYAEDLDVIICMELEGTRLRLYDLVGTSIPPLSALLDRIPHRVEEVVVHFAPDRLAAEANATPYVFDHDGPSYLMARGPFAAEGRPFTLPRSART